MKIKTKKQKTEPKKPVYYLKHGRVVYRYIIGLTWIQIDTDPKTDWPEMPEYMRVCFAIKMPTRKSQTPGPTGKDKNDPLVIGDHAPATPEEIEKAIVKAIKKKTNEQRKAYGTAPGRNKSLGDHSDKSDNSQNKEALPDHKRTKRKPVTPMLPFEGDNGSNVRTEFV
jgi:hypothetical protein